MEGNWVESEGAGDDAVGEHLKRAVGLVLDAGVLMGEADVGGEDLGEGGGWPEGGVHHDLLVVVPDEAVGEAVVVSDEGEDCEGTGGERHVQRGGGTRFWTGIFLIPLGRRHRLSWYQGGWVLDGRANTRFFPLMPLFRITSACLRTYPFRSSCRGAK